MDPWRDFLLSRLRYVFDVLGTQSDEPLFLLIGLTFYILSLRKHEKAGTRNGIAQIWKHEIERHLIF